MERIARAGQLCLTLLVSSRAGWRGLTLALPFCFQPEGGCMVSQEDGWLTQKASPCTASSAGGQSDNLQYIVQGGWSGLLENCFPAPLPHTLGLVNFFGVAAFVVSIPISIYSLPMVRKRVYHIFQLTHLPLAILFMVTSCLHDFQILYFTIPGIVNWYAGRKKGETLPATAKLLKGTSGPWVELSIDCSSMSSSYMNSSAPRGQWASIRVAALGREFHPLSVVSSSRIDGSTYLSALVSTKVGNWSKALSKLADFEGHGSFLEVEVDGVHPVGGGDWSFRGSMQEIDNDNDVDLGQPAILLIAGGTGVYGWLQGLATSVASGRRCVHLIWCVTQEPDYEALSERLPVNQDIRVTIYVTQGGISGAQSLLGNGGDLVGKFVTKRRKREGMASLAFQILLATLAPMAVGRWVWEEWMAPRVGKANSTLNYAITHRLLPIILVAFTMKIVFIAFTTMPTSANNVNATSPEDESEESSLMERMRTDRIKYATEKSTSSHHHEMEFGRPNIADVITKEIEEARSIGRTSLVVAACGPNALVSAARSAFEVASKNNRNKGFEMQFTGSESQW
eukprot:CAMPEP_0118671024 /NCGR_PEP_ID=MMETSP0785-20121206/21781_1 /TAXON_ID=91992 /ORGANISM="Bolidomonas pacifica, Strain CCMP 1866" /LENGTH=566 /DNA_ID=CAMNT_0006565881 /DNA_START=392 /DNA_END=2092 /DNA_ORIENTATION=+